MPTGRLFFFWRQLFGEYGMQPQRTDGYSGRRSSRKFISRLIFRRIRCTPDLTGDQCKYTRYNWEYIYIYIFKSLEIVFQNSIVFMFIWFFSRKISSKFKLISSRLCIYIYIVTWDKWQKKKLILLLYLWPCSTNRKTIVKNKSEEIIT